MGLPPEQGASRLGCLGERLREIRGAEFLSPKPPLVCHCLPHPSVPGSPVGAGSPTRGKTVSVQQLRPGLECPSQSPVLDPGALSRRPVLHAEGASGVLGRGLGQGPGLGRGWSGGPCLGAWSGPGLGTRAGLGGWTGGSALLLCPYPALAPLRPGEGSMDQGSSNHGLGVPRFLCPRALCSHPLSSFKHWGPG